MGGKNPLGPEDLARVYDQRFSGKDLYRARVWEILVRDFFQPRIGLEKSVLDLGCGFGEFINAVSAGEKFAMDANPESRARLSPEVRFFQQDVSRPWPLPPGSLDAVFTSNFFEHLPDKESLLDTLKNAAACLKPGGQILCLGPNYRYVGGAYWDFIDHSLALTERSLAEALEIAGFEVLESLARFLPYTMSQGREQPLALVRLYLRLRPAWRLFGKQFLVTARKPGRN